MNLRAYPLPRITVYPDRRRLTARNQAHRAFVDVIKRARAQAEYPGELLKARRQMFISQIGKIVT